MVETLFFIGGVIVGGIAVHTGYFASALTIQKTYEELTHLPDEIQNNTVQDKETSLRDEEGYDWDTYDTYVNRIEDGSDDVPES